MREDSVVAELFAQPLRGEEGVLLRLKDLLGVLPSFDQQIVLYSIIRTLAKKSWSDEQKILQGSGALISALCKNVLDQLESLQDWLVGSSPDSITYGPGVRRAVILGLSQDLGK